MLFCKFMSKSVVAIAAVAVSGVGIGTADAAQIRHFDANEGSGTTLVDGKHGLNGNLLNNGVTYVPDPWGGTAISFDGAAGYVQIPWANTGGTEPMTSMTTAGALEFWYYRPTDASNAGSFIIIHNAATTAGAASWEAQRLGVFGNSADNYIKGTTSNGTLRSTSHSTTLLTNDEWTHVVFTWGSNNQSLYQNGVLIASTSTSGQTPIIDISGQHVNIGYNVNGLPTSKFYKGYLDEISFWNEKLDAATIAARYQAGIDSMIPEPGSIALVGLGGLLLARRTRRSFHR